MSIRPTTFAKYEYNGLNHRVKKHMETGGARPLPVGLPKKGRRTR